ncbi:MAG: InlB B-repeat-containing protein [Treponema sp.]|nr:InlB B-repeat-containing protein [Treponema sp.]
MGIMNLSLFRKAYMLEFLENDVPKEVFTFAVPPESESFDFDQRVTETKTFGGSAFDDYGNDTIKITLSGSTVNEEKKLIYRGLRIPKFLTGEKEIFHLRDVLKKYGEIERVPIKKVYLYDLSKMSTLQLIANAGGGAPSKNYWRIAIKSLKIRRAKDKPFTFNYTLEMIGFDDKKDTSKTLFGEGFNDFINGVQKVLDCISMVMEYVELAAKGIALIAEAAVKVKEEVDRLKSLDWSDPAVAIKTSVGFISPSLGNFINKIDEAKKVDWSNPAAAINAAAGLLDSSLRIFSIDSQSNIYNSAKYLITSVNKFTSLGDAPKEMSMIKSDYNSFYIITFRSNGGSPVPVQLIDVGDLAVAPLIPKREHYLFVCWCSDPTLDDEYDFNSTVKKHTTLYAKWTQVSNVVTFQSNGGSEVPTQTLAIGQNVRKPDNPTKEGHDFVRWCRDAALANEFFFDTTQVNTPITIYASWNINVYSITFQSNGGSEVPTQNIQYLKKAVCPINPTKEGCLFIRWCLRVEEKNEVKNEETGETEEVTTEKFVEYNFSDPVIEDIILYANWYGG